MIRRAISRPGFAPGSPVNAMSSQDRLNHSHVPSYGVQAVRVNQNHPANLSPTRLPSVAADVALWPAWTKLAVEDLDLDQFAEDGTPLFGKGV